MSRFVYTTSGDMFSFIDLVLEIETASSARLRLDTIRYHVPYHVPSLTFDLYIHRLLLLFPILTTVEILLLFKILDNESENEKIINSPAENICLHPQHGISQNPKTIIDAEDHGHKNIKI